MSGLSPRKVRKILGRRFPEMSRETRQAIGIIFESLVNRLTLVRLNPLQQYSVSVDPQLTTECLVHLICEDLRAGGTAPAYVKMSPIEGGVGGDEGWVELTIREWSERS